MSSINSDDSEKLMKILIKWWNKEIKDVDVRREIKRYVFGLSFYTESQKEKFWERMMKKVNS